MFENIINFFKKAMNKEEKKMANSKSEAKERLHLVLMQDRANVSADFLELMKQEIIDVIKKYIEVDESAIDVRLTNQSNEDGTNGAPALYANIPITNIKNEARKLEKSKETKTDINEESSKLKENKSEDKEDVKKEDKNQEKTETKKEIKQEEKEESQAQEKEESKEIKEVEVQEQEKKEVEAKN